MDQVEINVKQKLRIKFIRYLEVKANSCIYLRHPNPTCIIKPLCKMKLVKSQFFERDWVGQNIPFAICKIKSRPCTELLGAQIHFEGSIHPYTGGKASYSPSTTTGAKWKCQEWKSPQSPKWKWALIMMKM